MLDLTLIRCTHTNLSANNLPLPTKSTKIKSTKMCSLPIPMVVAEPWSEVRTCKQGYVADILLLLFIVSLFQDIRQSSGCH